MKNSIKEAIEPIIGRDFVLEKPKDITLGDYATPVAFSLAKVLRKSPMVIADELCQKLQSVELFQEVTSIKGYVNFKLKKSFLDDFAKKSIKNSFTCRDKNQSILIEFVSANPTGPLHIGHARGAVVGDSLCRVGRHLGYMVASEYYVNDAGSQIELLGLSIYYLGKINIMQEPMEEPKEYYRGDYINDLAKLAKEKFGKEIFEDEKNIKTLSNWGKDQMLTRIQQDLASVDIEFDKFASERELYKKWDESFTKLTKNRKTYEKNDKIWIKSSECGDEKDRVIVREDSRPTYLAGDIIYHDDKFKRGFDRYINIWGADHHGYIARVKASINFLGFDEDKLEVILAQMVSLLKDGEPYKMSKRAGNFILMSDVVDEVGKDALRFIFLSKKCDTHLEFDVEILKKHDSSNPIYYINYAHARINQLFKKSGKNPDELLHVSFDNLSDDGVNLLFNALLLNEVLEDAFNTRQMQKITDYLKYLASLFHKFYNEHKVVGEQNEDVYLKLFSVVKASIHKGLELIGIEAKEVM